MERSVLAKTGVVVKQYAPLLLMCAVVIGCIIAAPSLFAFRHVRNVLSAAAAPVILACGLSVCFSGGYIDFAAVRSMLFGAVLSGVLIQRADAPDKVFQLLPELPAAVPLFAAVVFCAGFAVLPVLASARFRIPPVLSSLLFGFFLQGCAVLLAAGFTGTPSVITDFAAPVLSFGASWVGFDQVYSVPWIALIAAAVTSGCWLFTARSRLGISIGFAAPGLSGRYDLLTGESRKNTAENARNLRVLAVSLVPAALISGALYGLAGFIFAARTGSVSAGDSSDMWLFVFCGCLIGGVSVFGGRGSPVRAALGVCVCLFFEYAFDFLNVPAGMTHMCIAVCAAASLCLDAACRRGTLKADGCQAREPSGAKEEAETQEAPAAAVRNEQQPAASADKAFACAVKAPAAAQDEFSAYTAPAADAMQREEAQEPARGEPPAAETETQKASAAAAEAEPEPPCDSVAAVLREDQSASDVARSEAPADNAAETALEPAAETAAAEPKKKKAGSSKWKLGGDFFD